MLSQEHLKEKYKKKLKNDEEYTGKKEGTPR